MGPGTVLGGRYRLDDLLTDHDGARFWRATDLVLARSVAVHAVPSDDERADDVLEAARESATVTDPHFLRVLDCDDDGELTWVVNEWGSGLSLDLMLQRGTLPPSRAAWLAREVAEAVAAAHAEDVHHGRLNPESVLVTDSGAVKVIGFVTQRAFEGASTRAEHYGRLDPREADVIDLAGILYAALTGKWAGVSSSAVPPAPRDGGGPLRPRQVRAGIPRTLDQICDRVLAKEASQHALPIETAHEIAAALTDFVGDPASSAPFDVPSMYAEPTLSLPPRMPAGPGAGGADDDPDATRLATPPVPPAPGTEETRQLGPADSLPVPGPVSGTATDAGPDSSPDSAAGSAPSTGPPPFEQPPERPLFAEHERRVPKDAPVLPPYPPEARPAATTGTGTGTGLGTSSGIGPGYWPFEEGPEGTGSFSGKEGRGWLRLAAIIAVVVALVVAMFLAFNYGRGGDPEPEAEPQQQSPSPSVGERLQIVGARDFDPEGSPSTENPDEVPLAIDGNPKTGWQTLTYEGNPELGGLKSGVGLMIDLGADRNVGSVEISLAGAPTQLELYASDTGVSEPPADLGDLRQVTNSTRADESVTLRPKGDLRTRFLVIWMTRLPAVSGGYRGEITEVTVHS
jgi:hypothetical protein